MLTTEQVTEAADALFAAERDHAPITPISETYPDAPPCGLGVLGGGRARFTDIDIRRVGASLSINGSVEESGVASAVMGNPINSVAWLANKLHEYGVTAEAGHVILSGSFIKAIPF